MDNNFASIVAAGRKCIKASSVIGNSSSPRFECFHAPSSFCSEKVRCTLFIKGVDFIAYDADITTQENYQPGYVAVRNLGRGNQSQTFEALPGKLERLWLPRNRKEQRRGPHGTQDVQTENQERAGG